MMPNRIAMLAVLFFVVLLAQGQPGPDTGGGFQSRPLQTAKIDTSRNHAPSENDEGTPQPDYELKPWRALRGHLHNKMIHMPIGFAMSAFLLSLLALRWTEFQPAIRWLVLVAAFGSLVAYITGTNQAEAFEGGSKEWIIEIHERLGIATAITLWVWSASLWVRPMKRWAVLFGVLAMILVAATGFFGGVIAHG